MEEKLIGSCDIHDLMSALGKIHNLFADASNLSMRTTVLLHNGNIESSLSIGFQIKWKKNLQKYPSTTSKIPAWWVKIWKFKNYWNNICAAKWT